jgi:hypothetical protein
MFIEVFNADFDGLDVISQCGCHFALGYISRPFFPFFLGEISAFLNKEIGKFSGFLKKI